MSRLSATQRRVLADLAAGGHIAREPLAGERWRWVVRRVDGTTRAVSSATVEAAWGREWISWHQGRASMTAAGQGALTAATLPEAQP